MHSEPGAPRTHLLRKAGCLLLLLAALLGLRAGILWLDGTFASRGQQSLLIQQHDIDPAALFYTQSALALRAEKAVRKQVEGAYLQ